MYRGRRARCALSGRLYEVPALSRCALVRQTLDSISPPNDVHERDAGHLAYPTSQLAIASCNDVHCIRLYTLDNAVVGVSAPVVTLQAFKAWISSNSINRLAHHRVRIFYKLRRGDNSLQRNSIPCSQLLQLRHDTVRYTRDSLRIQAVHHASNQL